jgi:type VI protein secretion system component VasK
VNGARLRVALLYVNSTLRRGKRMTLARLTTSRVLCLLCAAIVCSGPLWFSLAPRSLSIALALGIAIVLVTWTRRKRHAMNALAPCHAMQAALTTTTNVDPSARIPTQTRRHRRRETVPVQRRSTLRRNDGNPRRRASLSAPQMLVENAPRIWPSGEPSSRYVH